MLLLTGTCIAVTTDGQRHLGAAIGPREYATAYVTKIQFLCDEIKLGCRYLSS